MTKFRHLIWMVIAALGLMLSVSQSFAQQPDVGDQPGLLPDDSVELDPEFRKQTVYYRSTEAPGTIIISTAERHNSGAPGSSRAMTNVYDAPSAQVTSITLHSSQLVGVKIAVAEQSACRFCAMKRHHSIDSSRVGGISRRDKT